MDIVIVGAGNVAASLGVKFVEAGHHILQLVARNADAAAPLARKLGTEVVTNTAPVNTEADVYIIAVPDAAIASVTKNLQLPGKVIAHTAASVHMDILKNVTENFGVFYPLQSLRKEIHTDTIPLYIEAANENTKICLEELARSISGAHVNYADFNERAKLHVAAVIVNNFTNHIFALAEDYCKKEKIEFSSLQPLIQNTVARLQNGYPSNMQTGPAARQDYETIAKHEALLKDHPKLLKLYRFITNSILNK